MQTTDERLLRINYSGKLHLQLCAVLSQMNKHDEALFNAKNALKRAQEAVNLNLKLCREHLERHKKLIGDSYLKKRVQQQPQYKLFESPHYLKHHQLVVRAIPILKTIDNENAKYLSKKKLNSDEIK